MTLSEFYILMYGKYTLKKQGINVWSMTYYETFFMLHSHALSNGFQNSLLL